MLPQSAGPRHRGSGRAREPAERIVLISDSVWNGNEGESRVRALSFSEGPDAGFSILRAASASLGDDATAIVLTIE